MKNISKKIISILLALVMVIGLSVCAFAADSKLVYTCLGDSNASGYNSTGWTANRVPAPEAYHSKIANALGAELRPFGSGGYRTDEILYLLDPTFEMDWSYAEICNGQVHKEDLDSYKDEYVQAVVDADIITIQVGANDIMGEDLGWAMLNAFYTPDENIEALKNLATSVGGELGDVLLKVVGAAEKGVQVVKFLADFAPRLAKTYSDFEANWDAIIENIYRLNPDVKIVALSVMNPFGNTSLTPGSSIKIGKVCAPIFNKLNKWMEKGSAYADTYSYCDVKDIVGEDLSFTQPDFMEKYLGSVHPTDEGHTVIAERVLAILEEN